MVCLKGVGAALSVALLLPQETQARKWGSRGKWESRLSPAFGARCSAQRPVVYCEFLLEACVCERCVLKARLDFKMLLWWSSHSITGAGIKAQLQQVTQETNQRKKQTGHQ